MGLPKIYKKCKEEDCPYFAGGCILHPSIRLQSTKRYFKKLGCLCKRKEGAIPPKDKSLGILAHDL
jgi:hypothetical protein